MLGKIYDKKTMFLRTGVGSATATDGVKYELCTLLDGSPMVTSSKTGKTMTFSWQGLVDYAIEHGINDDCANKDAGQL